MPRAAASSRLDWAELPARGRRAAADAARVGPDDRRRRSTRWSTDRRTDEVLERIERTAAAEDDPWDDALAHPTRVPSTRLLLDLLTPGRSTATATSTAASAPSCTCRRARPHRWWSRSTAGHGRARVHQAGDAGARRRVSRARATPSGTSSTGGLGARPERRLADDFTTSPRRSTTSIELTAPLDSDAVTSTGIPRAAISRCGPRAAGACPRRPGRAPRVARRRRSRRPASTTSLRPTREAPGGVVGLLMGGGPDQWPERYAVADPIALVPPAMRVLLVHGTDDAHGVGPPQPKLRRGGAGRRRRCASWSRSPARRAATVATSCPRARAGRRSRAGSRHAPTVRRAATARHPPPTPRPPPPAHSAGATSSSGPSGTPAPTLLTSGLAGETAISSRRIAGRRGPWRPRRRARGRATRARRRAPRGSPAYGREPRPPARLRPS